MVTNFEEVTEELTKEELEILPFIVKGFVSHDETNPIKAPKIVIAMNCFLEEIGLNIRISEPRLRKFVNYIRTNRILPLIATHNGYFVTRDIEIIKTQVESLMERSRSIVRCADGIACFLNPGHKYMK
jgi:hypothetical protein